MEKTIVLEGKTMRMRASALIPRLYRFKFGRDMISDMLSLKKAVAKADALPADATDEEREEAQLSVMDLTIFENVAWIMLKHAAEEREVVVGQDEDGNDIVERRLMSGDVFVGDSPDEWLDSFDGVFSVFEVLPVVLEMWESNLKTTSVPRKK